MRILSRTKRGTNTMKKGLPLLFTPTARDSWSLSGPGNNRQDFDMF